MTLNQAWGKASVAFIGNNNQATYYTTTPAGCQTGTTQCGHPDDKWGWAVLSGAEIKLPMLSPGSRLGFFFNYGVGAVRYSGGSNLQSAGLFGSGNEVALGVLSARKAYRRLQPAVVVGFGGYPSLPALLAARQIKIPTVIHEQNAVLGRVNRYLAPKADAVASAFPTLLKADLDTKAKVQAVGNPVRPDIRALPDAEYVPFDPRGKDTIRLLEPHDVGIEGADRRGGAVEVVDVVRASPGVDVVRREPRHHGRRRPLGGGGRGGGRRGGRGCPWDNHGRRGDERGRDQSGPAHLRRPQ